MSDKEPRGPYPGLSRLVRAPRLRLIRGGVAANDPAPPDSSPPHEPARR